MITNERQYKVTRTQAAKFEQAIKEFNELSLIEQGLDPLLIRAQRDALVSQLEDLQKEINKYEDLKSRKVTQLFATDPSELGQKLIEARIAQGLSQRELANRLGMKEQQIQRYEQERYASASLARLTKIWAALEVKFQFDLDLQQSPNLEEAAGWLEDQDIAKLPISVMKKRHWISASLRGSDLNSALKQFMAPAFESSGVALLRHGTRIRGHFDEFTLLAWKARIVWKVKSQIKKFAVPNFSDLSWLGSFKEFTLHEKGPALAVEFLRKKGIFVIFEAHLPHTHLDGAALLVDRDIFTIALTLRHDRLDNFWFVLLHELGHIIRHKDTGLRRGFFDDDETAATEAYEREADEFAKSVLLPSEMWLSSLIRFTQSEDQIIAFAQENRLSPAIIAGWIRRERRDYTVFKNLVGYRNVRRLLREAGLLEDANVGSA